MKYILAIALALSFAAPANALSCDLVKWAVANLSKETLAAYKAKATPEQLSEGRACLAPVQRVAKK